MAAISKEQLQPSPHRPAILGVSYPFPTLPEQQQASGLLKMMQGIFIGSVIAIIVLLLDPISPGDGLFAIAGVEFGSGHIAYIFVVLTSLFGLLSVAHWLSVGRLRRASLLFVGSLVVIGYLAHATNNPGDASIISLTLPLVGAGAVLKRRELTYVFGLVSTIALVNILLHELGINQFSSNHLLPEENAVFIVIVLTINFTILQVFAGGRLSLLEERGRLINELEQLNHNLEDRVTARTRDLELAAEVAREAAAEVDPEKLLPRVVDLTREAFGLYHVSIFVHDEETNILQLAAGTGEAGQRMKNINKRFQLDVAQGLVPKAARLKKPVVINDTTQSDEHFKNPILPSTTSEAALPMLVSGSLIGVIDLQSDIVDRFSVDDLRVLQTLTDQIAVSIRNSQLFAETEAARKQAEQADQVKSMFLASMSHELRTPLNSIINFTKFVERGVMGEINEKQKQALNNVINSGEHLLSLINDVLDISKIEAGSLTLFMEDNLDIGEIILNTQKTIVGLLAEKPVMLIIDIDPDLPKVKADQQRIYQVILNILSNACKFTKEGSIKVSATHQGEHLLVSVSDTGPGIASDDLDSVFEKFKQTHTGLRQGSGTGLGMPISKSLVEAHGGRLWVESVVDEGATFSFTLPLEIHPEIEAV